MRFVPFLLPLALALAFMLGWSFPGLPEEPLTATRGRGPISSLVLRPGEGTAQAVRFLRTLQYDPPPPAPPPTVVMAPPPPPPPPDVSVTFRSALSAITRDPDTGTYSALIRDVAGGPQVTSMSVGDSFDGWRITNIGANGVTLRRNREQRTVRLYG